MQWTRAICGTYDPQTATYSITGSLVGGVTSAQRVLRDPGDTTVIPPGTTIILHNCLGVWLIDGIIKEADVIPGRLPPPVVTEVRGLGGEDPVRPANGNAPAMRSADTPVDVLQGDYVRHSPDGNHVGVLAGGVNVMQSTPFSAIRMHALDPTVEVFAHKYRHMSAMGNMEIKSNDGKTSLVWRAGADQSDENGPDRENWTIRMDVGASGNMFNFAVTQPDGALLSRIHMSATGRVEIFGIGGVDIVSGGDPTTTTNEVVLSSKVISYEGNLTQNVAGAANSSVVGTRTEEVSGNQVHLVGNDHNQTVGRDWNHTVNGKVRQRVIGGLVPIPGATAYEMEVINGGVTYLMSDLQNFNVLAKTGAINFSLGPVSGGFNVLSALPGSVKLGADGIVTRLPDGTVTVVPVAAFAATMFEPLQTALLTLIALFDTHVHPTAVGPTLTPIVPISATPVPQLIQLARSQRVSIGL